MRAFFYDEERHQWCAFDDIYMVLETNNEDEILTLIDKMENLIGKHSLFSLGFITYEASIAFDVKYSIKKQNKPDSKHDDIKLPFFSCTLYRSMTVIHPSTMQIGSDFTLSPFISLVSEAEHGEKVRKIKDYLFRGDTYQINYTIPMRARFSGDPLSWFFSKITEKHGGYGGYIEGDTYVICSFSPELFFARTVTDIDTNMSSICCKPMKGTKRRNIGTEDKDRLELSKDEKNRAENIMITDMVRNDLGKIASPGSVLVPSLCTVETYPTLFQMTSTVTAQTKAPLLEIFKALFPSASITGAPKMRSMEIINELEDHRRGVYTGSMFMIRSDTSAVCNVAIRTAVFDKEFGIAEYKVGGGIVWQSDPHQEYEECMTKALSVLPPKDFFVFESMLLESGSVFLLERHLNRLLKSAIFFFFIKLKEASALVLRLKKELNTVIVEHPQGEWKVRLLLYKDSRIVLECSPITQIPDPYTISLSSTRVHSSSFFLYHKTSFRSYIDDAIKNSTSCADVILINEKNEVTESTRASIILRIKGKDYTPPLSSGLLPGVYREELLENGEIEERICTVEDYKNAEEVFVINSVRRKILCVRV